MSMCTDYQEKARFGGHETICPYNGVSVCTASFSSITIDNRKMEGCCGTDDYDSCPIFLSKVLRKP